MIDPATSWIEICSVPGARVDLITNQVELVWLARYFLLKKITLDRGKELFNFFHTISNSKLITTVLHFICKS